jgi:MoxR-like ATPase
MKPYTGKKLTKPYKDKDGKTILEAYLPSKALIDAVNLAIFLQRPLLIMGDPGCGKTRLAEAVAYDLYGEEYEDDLFFEWNVKSTSKAKDGLYRYKALEKLRDAQTDNLKIDKETGEVDENHYIKMMDLGKAFKKSTTEKRTILLIDEIDKADMDFPNDLLLELEESEFTITETGETIKAEAPPIVFITSNNEHDSKLSPAFLRRCLYHHITFPEKDDLVKILNSHFEVEDKTLIDEVVDIFLKIRAKQEANDEDKKVSTSELIDWFKVINHCKSLDENTVDGFEKSLLEQLALLGTEKIPFHQVLIKNWNGHLNNL